MSGLLVFFILALLAVFVVFIFNQLVSLKHNVGKAWSNIDMLLMLDVLLGLMLIGRPD
ncbi:MAG: hypothetical protein M1449_02520 [Candidatus Thermoplasmatota archaeon]|nr:hypothetical protein [Candidatus Thermoplasmatota archaeon]